MNRDKYYNLRQKERREMFGKTTNSFIMKTGADKDPVMEVVLQFAQQAVDKAFELYPDEAEEQAKETSPDFKK